MASKYEQYVHQITTKSGATRYAVAEWLDDRAQYQWPLPRATRRATNCHTGFSKHAAGSDWNFATRSAALSCARRLFGERDSLGDCFY